MLEIIGEIRLSMRMGLLPFLSDKIPKGILSNNEVRAGVAVTMPVSNGDAKKGAETM